jgi:hypothetical protein
LTRRNLARLRVAVIVVVILAVGSGVGYFFYNESYGPGSLFLSVQGDGPYVPQTDCGSCGWIYDSSVLNIWLNYVRVEVHSAGHTNQSGWTTIFSSGGSLDYRLTGGPIDFDYPRLAPGVYDQIRFNVTSAIVNIREVGNVTYPIVGRGFMAPFNGGGGFLISSGKFASVWIVITFLGPEIHTLGHITPHAVAHVNVGGFGCALNACT